MAFKLKRLNELKLEVQNLACEFYTRRDENEGMSAQDIKTYTDIVCELSDNFEELVKFVMDIKSIENRLKESEDIKNVQN